MDRSFQGLVFSLCVHAAFVIFLMRANCVQAPPHNETPTEITILEKDDRKGPHKIMIEPDNQKPPPPTAEELKKEADFLSAFTKRVKQRMAVRNLGEDKNAQAAQQKPKGDAEGIAGDRQRGNEREGFLAPGGGQSLRTVAIGQSSLSQIIPGVEEGAFTALNTDQLEFYAFYQRSNEQIRNRWVALIREYMGQLAAREMEILAKRNRTTQVEIQLSPAGDFVKAIIHSGSGDRGLDQAAVESFRRAAPFPNPPSEMVKADGKIHLFYAFTLYLRPPSFGPAVN